MPLSSDTHQADTVVVEDKDEGGGEQQGEVAPVHYEHDSDEAEGGGEDEEDEAEADPEGPGLLQPLSKLVDDDGEDEDDDGPEAEGDEAPSPRAEPSYSNTNAIGFYRICKLLEECWENANPNASSPSAAAAATRSVGGSSSAAAGTKNRKPKKQKKWTELDRLKHLLRPDRLEKLRAHAPGEPPQSVFPLYRLLMPEKDASRFFGMKEKRLADVYSRALGLSKQQRDHLKLTHFHDPQIVGTTDVGDFSLVLNSVMKGRIPDLPSKYTVGEINKLLDDLCSLPERRKSNHDWKVAASSKTGGSNNNKKSGKSKSKAPALVDLQAQWVRTLNPERGKSLSRLEHKWLVRIILESLKIKLGYKKILNWYHPMGAKLWTAHNSLKGVCNKLCYPEFERLRDKNQGDDDGGAAGGRRLASYMPESPVEISFGNPFEPMFSTRTGFDRMMSDISKRHREAAADREGSPVLQSALAVQHPAFTVETKLDGERMILHVSRDGIVRIQSRRSRWYSGIYTPVLGPAVRRAVGKLKMDIVLDGEVLAWDSARSETVPFGNNRTIANFRRKYMEKTGLCEVQDQDVHKDDAEKYAEMNPSSAFGKTDEAYEIAGKECWLLFVAFDVLYLDGPGAAELLDETVSKCITPRPAPGSLIGLDGFERKKILHRVVDVQQHEVEIVQTFVIRPNGQHVLGSDYFSATNPVKECGFPAYTLDSMECTLSGSIPDLDRIDSERRMRLSDEEISRKRAWAVDKIYKRTVEDQRMEGLIMKDLSAPYVLGDFSRSLRYWHKFKPDYFGGSFASDLDVVIIGAYFATGLRNAGRPSSYLCACVDSDGNRTFFPVCKVNAGSMDSKSQTSFLELTGFKLNSANESHDGGVEYGKWFREDDRSSLPDFISLRKVNKPGDLHDEGWRLPRDVYPDIWIHPKDSSVVTLNAGEIVESDSFPAGCTLRFPRIHRLREDGDSKDPYEIESERSLQKKYHDVVNSRQGNDAMGTVAIGSPTPASQTKTPSTMCRFLTENQFAIKQKEGRKRGSSAPTRVKSVVENVAQVSSVLAGLSFTVYEGRYSLRDNEIDKAAAREEGWYDEAMSVTSSTAVKYFIKQHGGTLKLTADPSCIVLGGRKDDDCVVAHVNAIEAASRRGVKSAKMTLTEKKNAMLAMHDGVVRWSYVYSLVHSLLNKEKAQQDPPDQAAGSSPETKKPTILDYLLRPSKLGKRRKRTAETVCREDLSNHIMMWRAVDLVEKDNVLAPEETTTSGDETGGYTFDTWQDGAMKLDPEDRWIVSCQHQTLWPYAASGGTGGEGGRVVLYPDIFDDAAPVAAGNGSAAARKNRVEKEILESCLPLARVMGATVASSLDDDSFTHVLCHLAGSRDRIDSSDGRVTAQVFSDPARGQRLLDKLAARLTAGNSVVFVSPSWIRDIKWHDADDC